MKSKDEDIHIGLLQYLMISTGIWPLKINNPIYAFLYKLYFYFCESIMIYFIITVAVYVPFAYNHGFDIMIENFMFTIIHVVTWLKRIICQSKDTMDLLNDTKAKNLRILRSGNEEIIRIYKAHTASANKMKITLIGIMGLLYVAFTSFKYLHLIHFWDASINATSRSDYYRPTPVISWKPFNTDNHYYGAFFVDMITPVMGAIYIILSYALYIDFIMYVICQIRILQYFFKKLEKYSEIVQRKYGLGAEEASYTALGSMHFEHQYIITFVDKLNVALSNLFLLEYIVNSIIMAIVLINITQNSTFYVTVFPILYLAVVVFQLLTSYYQASEITLEHSALSLSIYESNWYDQSVKLRKDILIMMIRTQRDLTLSLGPFYPMNIDLAIKSLKAAYSYVTLMRNSRLGE